MDFIAKGMMWLFSLALVFCVGALTAMYYTELPWKLLVCMAAVLLVVAVACYFGGKDKATKELSSFMDEEAKDSPSSEE